MKYKNNHRRKRNSIFHLIPIGLRSLKTDGIAVTYDKTARTLGIGGYVTYEQWAKKPLYTEEELGVQRRQVYDKSIKFSIITPLNNTPEVCLRDMIDSVIAQTYPNWELCVADCSNEGHRYVENLCREYAEKESRIKYRKLEKNYGAVGNSNACIDMAEGDYIAILDQGDILHPAALHDVMKVICEEGADFIYTDEAIFKSPDIKKITMIHFKPDYAIDTLRAINYICHFTSFQRGLLERCGSFREGFEGSQDHDLILRLTATAENIVHIPEVLYYWRSDENTTGAAEDYKLNAGASGRKAVLDSLREAGIKANISNAEDMPTVYRLSYELPIPEPKVSIIIPSCDHSEDLRLCISSILKKTTYRNYEIIVVENNSTQPATFSYYDEISGRYDNVRVIRWPGKGFNWAALNNYGVSESFDSEYILLLNNDTEVISPEWIQEMMMYAQRPDVGVVGAKLYYPDDTIQHAGVILGLGGVAGHMFCGLKREDSGYMGRLSYAQDLSAVTGACMLMRREVFEKVGGIDEAFAVGLNDIDLCMRIRKAGYLVVWTPYAELYHYEKKSRGNPDTPDEKAEFKEEIDRFKGKWDDELAAGDPYYNPNFSLNTRTGFKLVRERKIRRHSF